MRKPISSGASNEPFYYLLPLQKCWKAQNNFSVHLSTLFAASAQNLFHRGTLSLHEAQDSTTCLVSKWRSEGSLQQRSQHQVRTEQKNHYYQLPLRCHSFFHIIFSKAPTVTCPQALLVARAGSLAKNCTKVITQKST